jgi:aspartate aminotransferase/aminotransferase
MGINAPVKYAFSRRVSNLKISGIRRIFELARGMPDAVDLSIGQPHFEPPAAVRAAAARAMDEGHNRYVVTQGIPELREALHERLRRRMGVDPGTVLVTAGATGAIFLTIMALVDEGDEVLVADPAFVVVRMTVEAAGGIVRWVDTYPDFRLTVERLERAVTPRTRILSINSPTNPTGTAYRRDELAALAAFARRHELIVLSDEIYDAFVYDRPHESMRPHYEHTVTFGGFSKTYGVPGWRLGWCAGPPEIIDRVAALQQFSFVSANSASQRAALTMLRTDMVEWIAPYRAKRDLAYEGLRDRYEVVRPEGAFYLFARAPGDRAEAFVQRAIDRKLLLVPGGAFSNRDTHFRLSFAAEDDAIKRGIDILRELAAG